MDRRKFIGALAGGVLAGPLFAQAQPASKVWRIGWLYEGVAPSPGTRSIIDIFREELQKLGYLDTRDYLILTRFANGRTERLPELVGELTALPVDVLIAASTPTTLAAMQATRTIPIVTIGSADPVASGLTRSYDRPGGNVTGTTWHSTRRVVSGSNSSRLYEVTSGGLPSFRIQLTTVFASFSGRLKPPLAHSI